MVGLTIYCIGVIFAVGLMYALGIIDSDDDKELGMAWISAALSWLTVFFVVYKAYDEIRKDRKNPFP